MSKELTKENVIQNKKEAIKSLNKLLEYLINNNSDRHLKKANLISYWVKDYARMINFEERFEPTKNIAYKRGNIVKLNFGFNIGAEYGGLHYGIVLDNKNAHNSPIITIIPLTSSKIGKDIHPNSIELGNEIYRSLKLKYDTILKTLKNEQKEIEDTLELLNVLANLASDSAKELLQYTQGEVNKLTFQEKVVDTQTYISSARTLQMIWKEKFEHNNEEQIHLAKIGNEISKMKEGSIALVNQITTVSKLRIFDPRNLKGVLAGISLSKENMEKVNEKVKELYVFQ